MIQRLIILGIAVFLTACSTVYQKDGSSAEKPKEKVLVRFAGFAYLGKDKDIKSSFAYINRFDGSGKQGSWINQRLNTMMKGLQADNLIFKDGLAELKQGNNITLAFAVDKENLSVSRIGKDYKLMIEIGAQALFFDFDTMSIVAAYPISYRSNFAYRGRKPTENDKRKAIQAVFENAKQSPLTNFIEIVKSSNINSKYGNNLRVVSADVSEKAYAKLPSRFRRSDHFESGLAQSFGGYLSKHQNVSILPYVKGHAIGKKMPGRFADGRVFALSIPEADYEITLTLNNLGKQLYKQTKIQKAERFGASVSIVVKEPLTDTVYMDADFQQVSNVVMPMTQQSVDDWPAYQSTIQLLFNDLTKELSDPSRSWASSHSNKDGVVKEMERFTEVLNRCR